MLQDRTLLLARGLPGSAKTSLARHLTRHNFAADDYFERNGDGSYQFDRSKIKEAHEWCQERTEQAMADGVPLVAVHNTFSKAWEARHYYALAANYGYSVFVVECQNEFGNVHDVPESIVERMREGWEPLNRPALPLSTILRVRFWDAWYNIKRAVRSFPFG